jgi:hypothetical protein
MGPEEAKGSLTNYSLTLLTNQVNRKKVIQSIIQLSLSSYRTVRHKLSKDTLGGVSLLDIVKQHLEILASNLLQLLYGADTIVLTSNGVLLERSDGRVHACAIHGVTDSTGVGKVRQCHAQGNVTPEHVVGILINVVLELSRHDSSDLSELISTVVGEVNVVTNTRHHTGNVREEKVHAVLVSGKSDNKIVLLVLHDVKKNFNRLLTVITVVGSIEEVVSLIDEEDTSHGLLDHFLGLGGSVANVLADKIITSGKDNVSTAGVSHLGKDLSHTDSDSGLSGSGGTSETHVQRRHSSLESELAAHLVENKKRGNLLDTLLDRDKTNKFTVKLVELFLDTLLVHKLAD